MWLRASLYVYHPIVPRSDCNEELFCLNFCFSLPLQIQLTIIFRVLDLNLLFFYYTARCSIKNVGNLSSARYILSWIINVLNTYNMLCAFAVDLPVKGIPCVGGFNLSLHVVAFLCLTNRRNCELCVLVAEFLFCLEQNINVHQ